MRFVSLFAILASTALSGCAGGDGSALSLASSGVQVCGIGDPNCAIPTPTSSGGGGSSSGGSSSGGSSGGGTNTGNTAVVTTGDATIALEKARFLQPTSGTALTTLKITSAPNTATFSIDTKSASKGAWPTTKTMKEYLYGTNSTGGTGLGGTYKEYRYYVKDIADEELQVWTFNHSRATHYRDDTAGGAPAAHEAWSFESYDSTGGTADQKASLTNLKTKATATYTGEFGATAQSSNWVEDASTSGGTGIVMHNNNWSVRGTSNFVADFSGTNNFSLTGTLTPTVWNAMDGNNKHTDVLSSNTGSINHVDFMNDQIIINGTINGTATGNSITGTAAIDPAKGWLNGDTASPVYGSIFGTDAKEITGIFNVDATSPDPTGGTPTNNPVRGYLQMGGVFHGTAP
jgi:C-lobe and N-lobe beta barrels of Tf-binding protein B